MNIRLVLMNIRLIFMNIENITNGWQGACVAPLLFLLNVTYLFNKGSVTKAKQVTDMASRHGFLLRAC